MSAEMAAARPDRATLQERLAASYQPAARVAFLVAVCYLAVLFPIHYVTETAHDFLLLGGISAIALVAFLAMHREFGRRTLSFRQLEFRVLGGFMLCLTGLIAHHLAHLDPPRLLDFLLLALVTATISISLRVAVAAIGMSVAAMVAFLLSAGGTLLQEFAFVLVSGMATSLCLAVMVRRFVSREIQARIAAEALRSASDLASGADMLTELPGRRQFFRAVKDRLSGRKHMPSRFALAIADLDGFKPVNDTFGHAIGDKLLFEVSKRLRAVCDDRCFIARLGGDEFALIIDNPCNEAELRKLGERICAMVSEPYEIVGIRMSVSISIGMFLSDDVAITESEVMERADYALYHAKDLKCGVVIYAPEHETARRKETAIGHALKSADFDAEMHIVFQPQVAMDTGRTQGFEALARWSSPELGVVPPDVFIRTAERIGMIEHLTPLLLRKALATAVEWPSHFKLSFNLSIRDIISANAVDRICAVVKESGFSASQLEFEVTETLIITDFEQAKRSLAILRDLGASIALDDFGVGYTNFEYIDELSVSTIKIDRSFVARMQAKNGAGKVIEAMIGLCTTLGIKNVVEGVETEHQLKALKEAGADCVQGYHFSKPLPADEIPFYLLREQLEAPDADPVRAAAAR